VKNLWTDTEGSAATSFMSLAPTWFVVFSVFLMNVQLSRNYVQRDVVDHAASLAADAAMKVACADAQDYGGSSAGDLSGERLDAVNASIQNVLSLVSSGGKECHVSGRPSAGSGASGGRTIDVEVTCDFACTIPIAAQVMCSGSPPHVTFSAHQTAVAMGCDESDGS
jgi:hypothetical protein